MQEHDPSQAEPSTTEFTFSHTTTMNERESQFLINRLKDSRNYLEFGSGFSTIEACRLVKNTIISVETSVPYLSAMSDHLTKLGVLHSNVFLHHADIGQTGAWGYPVDEIAIKKWSQYSDLNFKNYQTSFRPDLALIDGRFRVATFLKLFLHYPGLSIIFDDYFDRPQYSVVENVLKPKKQIDRIAFFQVPRFRMPSKCNLASSLLQEFILNPE
jgi:hypothetical protein